MFFRSRLQEPRSSRSDIEKAVTIIEASGLFVLGIDDQDGSGESRLQRGAAAASFARFSSSCVASFPRTGRNPHSPASRTRAESTPERCSMERVRQFDPTGGEVAGVSGVHRYTVTTIQLNSASFSSTVRKCSGSTSA
jgi:hypothetical protein